MSDQDIFVLCFCAGILIFGGAAVLVEAWCWRNVGKIESTGGEGDTK